MLIAYPKSRQYGFTLVELLVGVVILAILASMAIPNFQTWIRNSEIRNAAESITNGLQRARAEAVARNTNVAFMLGAGSSWNVSVVTPASGIDARSSLEGSKNVTATALAADIPITTPPTFANATAATTITFNNLGGVATNKDGSAPIAKVDLAETGGTQNLRVTIGLGGNARMCDPNAPSGTTRACN